PLFFCICSINFIPSAVGHAVTQYQLAPFGATSIISIPRYPSAPNPKLIWILWVGNTGYGNIVGGRYCQSDGSLFAPTGVTVISLTFWFGKLPSCCLRMVW